MSGSRYSPAVLERLRDPRCAGCWPADDGAVRTGQAGAEERGIWIRLQLRGPRSGPLEAGRFQAFGCPVAIACASWLAEQAAGRSPEALASLTPERLCEALELTDQDAATARLALGALRGALRGA